MATAITFKLLHVDLGTRQTRVEEIPEVLVRKHLGGGALACYLLLRDLPPGVDPLGPDNILVFTTSVINGMSLSGSNRYTAAAKSPLTGGYGEAEAGGWWGPELRATGYDGVMIRGRAETPVYLWIKDGQVEFRDARPYWGKLSGEVQDGLEQELGDKRIRVLQTGVAGERGVRYAAIVNQLKHFHGRAGLGAVMGSKHLKAIAVRGSKIQTPVDKEGAKAGLTWFREHYDRKQDRFHQLGSASGVLALEASGILPTRNFRDGSFEHARAISGQTMAETILVNRGTCYACAVACKREVEVPERRRDAEVRRARVRDARRLRLALRRGRPARRSPWSTSSSPSTSSTPSRRAPSSPSRWSATSTASSRKDDDRRPRPHVGQRRRRARADRT